MGDRRSRRFRLPSLAATLAGLMVALPGSVGAVGPLRAGGVHPSRQPPSRVVTFNRDVAPILREKCAGCHRPGGGAPFSLLTFEDARSRASLIARATATRYMPPWKPEPG